ncbi:MAG TPA: acyl-ACP thioesterase domain-containing protein [Ktedonobacteraceae bacterium]
MRREFTLTHTARYDECTCDGIVAPRAFFQYMQDIAARDAEDANLGGDGFWVIKRTAITFVVPIPVHTPLLLRTFGLGFTRITAQRGYEAHFADQTEGEPVISARSLWVYVDQRGRPARLPERTAEIWLPGETLAPQPDAALPPLPDSEPEVYTTRVSFSQVDLARHLNNAVAVQMLDDAAWDACARAGLSPDTTSFTACSYDVEYIDSPRFGEELLIQTWFEPFPQPGREFQRVQQIVRAGKVMVRASSRWFLSLETRAVAKSGMG